MTDKYKFPVLTKDQIETFNALQQIGGLADIGMLTKHGGHKKSAEDLVSLGLAEKSLYPLSEDNEWRLKSYRLDAMMFLEFAAAEETCEKGCFMTVNDAIWLAHQLIQGPHIDGNMASWEWTMNKRLDYQTKEAILSASIKA
jgi:hypothetical protein